MPDAHVSYPVPLSRYTQIVPVPLGSSTGVDELVKGKLGGGTPDMWEVLAVGDDSRVSVRGRR